MRSSLTRTLVVIATIVCTSSWVAASDLGFSGFERRIGDVSQNGRASQGVRQVAHFSDVNVNDEYVHDGSMPVSETGCSPVMCEDYSGYCPPGAYSQPARGMYYSEVQLMFIRAHVMEGALGKLSEKYEISPRFIVGYEGSSGLGVRGRHWMYDRTTDNRDDPALDLGLDFQVTDLEGTARFRTERADLVVAGGFRWVDAEVEVLDQTADATMPGLTLAADTRAWLCRSCSTQWSGVAGVRWSVLGTDWEGDSNLVVDTVRDDNVVVHELYGGVEYLCHYGIYDLYARIVFEVQNWHSDAIAQNAGTDSIGFVGPGVHVGATF